MRLGTPDTGMRAACVDQALGGEGGKTLGSAVVSPRRRETSGALRLLLSEHLQLIPPTHARSLSNFILRSGGLEGIARMLSSQGVPGIPVLERSTPLLRDFCLTRSHGHDSLPGTDP